MSIAHHGLEALDVQDPPTPRAQAVRTQAEVGRPSRVRRREVYLVSVAAGLAAIGVCVASYMWDARQHAEPNTVLNAPVP